MLSVVLSICLWTQTSGAQTKTGIVRCGAARLIPPAEMSVKSIMGRWQRGESPWSITADVRPTCHPPRLLHFSHFDSWHEHKKHHLTLLWNAFFSPWVTGGAWPSEMMTANLKRSKRSTLSICMLLTWALQLLQWLNMVNCRKLSFNYY